MPGEFTYILRIGENWKLVQIQVYLDLVALRFYVLRFNVHFFNL